MNDWDEHESEDSMNVINEIKAFKCKQFPSEGIQSTFYVHGNQQIERISNTPLFG